MKFGPQKSWLHEIENIYHLCPPPYVLGIMAKSEKGGSPFILTFNIIRFWMYLKKNRVVCKYRRECLKVRKWQVSKIENFRIFFEKISRKPKHILYPRVFLGYCKNFTVIRLKLWKLRQFL